jgi:transcriptional regulator with XRE-family HTH domain
MTKKFVVDIRGYLDQLQSAEETKPANERKPVPTISHLAEVAGMSRQAMSNLANGRTRLVNLDVLAAVIIELRRWGFTETDLRHILVPEK